MPGKIQMKRGTYAAMDLNALYQGELYYCTDTKAIYMAHGDGTGVLIAAGATAAATLTALGLTASAAELNVLDGVAPTLTAAEINYLDGVTSAIQTQLDAKAAIAQANWTDATLVNSWANVGITYPNAGYYKDTLGTVHLRGAIKTGSVPSTAFTLPSGYRPAADELYAVASNDAYGQLQIKADGTVAVLVGSSTWVSLSGITFRAA